MIVRYFQERSKNKTNLTLNKRSQKKCLTARLLASFIAGHPWVCVDGVAPDKPLDSAVLTRLKQFSAMNKFKKLTLRV